MLYQHFDGHEKVKKKKKILFMDLQIFCMINIHRVKMLLNKRMSRTEKDLRNISQFSPILYRHWRFWECLCIISNCKNIPVRKSLCFQMFRIAVHLRQWMILQGPPKGHFRCKKYSLQGCNNNYCLQMTT